MDFLLCRQRRTARTVDRPCRTSHQNGGDAGENEGRQDQDTCKQLEPLRVLVAADAVDGSAQSDEPENSQLDSVSAPG